MSRCDGHPEDVLLCSCGYERQGLKDPVIGINRIMEEEVVKRKYTSWGAVLQRFYRYWLDLAKPFETQPLEAATFAVRKTERFASPK